MVKQLAGIEYQWEIGENSRRSVPAPVTYLIGYLQLHVT